MNRSLSTCVLLALTGLASPSAAARAEFSLRVPFVTVRLFQPAPPVPPPVLQPAAPTVPGAPAEPVLEPAVPTLPPPGVVPAPAVVPVKPIAPADFVASFKPLPGKYEVLFLHPKTGCPVKVCFTLPPGCVRKVRVNAHRIEFVYAGHHDVVIRFLHNGKVWVRE